MARSTYPCRAFPSSQNPSPIDVPASGPRPSDSWYSVSSRPLMLKLGGCSLTTNWGTSSTVMKSSRPISNSKPSLPLISQLNGSTRTEKGGILKPSPFGGSGGGGGGG